MPKENEYEILTSSSWGSLLDAEDDSSEQDMLSDEEPRKGRTTYELSVPLKGKEIYLVHNLYSAEESGRLISVSEAIGYGQTEYPKNYRGNLRLMTDDESLALRTWERLKNIIPEEVEEKGKVFKVVGLNTRWRLAKYYKGDRFAPHVDAYFEDGLIKSMYTVNIYMNETYSGGSTSFTFANATRPGGFSSKIENFEIIPKTGLALIFRQPPHQRYMHEGLELNDGIKYLFRSDVLYKQI